MVLGAICIPFRDDRVVEILKCHIILHYFHYFFPISSFLFPSIARNFLINISSSLSLSLSLALSHTKRLKYQCTHTIATISHTSVARTRPIRLIITEGAFVIVCMDERSRTAVIALTLKRRQGKGVGIIRHGGDFLRIQANAIL